MISCFNEILQEKNDEMEVFLSFYNSPLCTSLQLARKKKVTRRHGEVEGSVVEDMTKRKHA